MPCLLGLLGSEASLTPVVSRKREKQVEAVCTYVPVAGTEEAKQSRAERREEGVALRRACCPVLRAFALL